MAKNRSSSSPPQFRWPAPEPSPEANGEKRPSSQAGRVSNDAHSILHHDTDPLMHHDNVHVHFNAGSRPPTANTKAECPCSPCPGGNEATNYTSKADEASKALVQEETPPVCTTTAAYNAPVMSFDDLREKLCWCKHNSLQPFFIVVRTPAECGPIEQEVKDRGDNDDIQNDNNLLKKRSDDYLPSYFKRGNGKSASVCSLCAQYDPHRYIIINRGGGCNQSNKYSRRKLNPSLATEYKSAYKWPRPSSRQRVARRAKPRENTGGKIKSYKIANRPPWSSDISLPLPPHCESLGATEAKLRALDNVMVQAQKDKRLMVQAKHPYYHSSHHRGPASRKSHKHHHHHRGQTTSSEDSSDEESDSEGSEHETSSHVNHRSPIRKSKRH